MRPQGAVPSRGKNIGGERSYVCMNAGIRFKPGTCFFASALYQGGTGISNRPGSTFIKDLRNEDHLFSLREK